MSSAKWRPFCRGLNVLKSFGTSGVRGDIISKDRIPATAATYKDWLNQYCV